MTPNTAIGTKNATHSKRVAVAKGGNHRLFSGARPPSSSKAMEKAGIPLIEAEKTVIAEDFSEYEVRHPGVFGWLGLGDVPSLHNNKFDFDEEVMQTGINAFIGLLDYFEEK